MSARGVDKFRNSGCVLIEANGRNSYRTIINLWLLDVSSGFDDIGKWCADQVCVVVTFETGGAEIQRRIWPIRLVDTKRRFCGVASAGVRGSVV
jgi:hypothetical protein